MAIYLFIVYPIINLILGKDTGEGNAKTVWFIGYKLLPYFLMLWSNVESRFLMKKQMYICPMNQEERRNYINAVVLVKIIVSMLFGILLDLVWMCFFGLDVVRSGALYTIYFTLGIATYTCVPGRNKWGREISFGRRTKNGDIKGAWLNIFTIVLSIIFLIGFEGAALAEGEGAVEIGEKLAIASCFLVLFILDGILLGSRYKAVVEYLTDYEAWFDINEIKTVEKDIFEGGIEIDEEEWNIPGKDYIK